ncbi:MAG: hypothetical protein HQK91_03435 [Nitrospirae bacterium]|nr:hypothetical protein [Nitrospirota bacterium]
MIGTTAAVLYDVFVDAKSDFATLKLAKSDLLKTAKDTWDLIAHDAPDPERWSQDAEKYKKYADLKIKTYDEVQALPEEERLKYREDLKKLAQYVTDRMNYLSEKKDETKEEQIELVLMTQKYDDAITALHNFNIVIDESIKKTHELTEANRELNNQKSAEGNSGLSNNTKSDLKCVPVDKPITKTEATTPLAAAVTTETTSAVDPSTVQSTQSSTPHEQTFGEAYEEYKARGGKQPFSIF